MVSIILARVKFPWKAEFGDKDEEVDKSQMRGGDHLNSRPNMCPISCNIQLNRHPVKAFVP